MGKLRGNENQMRFLKKPHFLTSPPTFDFLVRNVNTVDKYIGFGGTMRK
jgi:hypothetical protein